MEDSFINYRNINNKETIEIDLEDLLDYQENHETLPLRITDIEKMKKWFEKYLQNMFIDAYEHGEAWLEGVNY